jgi:hypothetical protein
MFSDEDFIAVLLPSRETTFYPFVRPAISGADVDRIDRVLQPSFFQEHRDLGRSA